MFNVYVLIDNNKTDIMNSSDNDLSDIEFYGFIKIGYLVNPRGYNNDEIINFENKVGFNLRSDIKHYLTTTSLLKYDNKLFHINLRDIATDNKVINKFGYSGEKTISNIKYINKFNNSVTDEEKELVCKEEDDYLSNLENGFLYIGSIKKLPILINDKLYIKSEKNVYLLLNYDDVLSANYDFSLWVYSYDNQNFDREITKEKTISYTVKNNIFKTMKCMANLNQT